MHYGDWAALSGHLRFTIMQLKSELIERELIKRELIGWLSVFSVFTFGCVQVQSQSSLRLDGTEGMTKQKGTRDVMVFRRELL